MCFAVGKVWPTGQPLSALIYLLIDINYRLQFVFLSSDQIIITLRSTWYLTINYVTNCFSIGEGLLKLKIEIVPLLFGKAVVGGINLH